jgi:perosamine synthetase
MSTSSTRTTLAARSIPFHRACVGEEEVQAVAEVVRSGWLTMGPKTIQFEQEFAKYVEVRHALAVSSGTAGLHLALEAIGIRSGDEVLVPTLTFAATAEVVTYLGARPVLVDCEPVYFNFDCRDAVQKITCRTKAILPVHFAGNPCEMSTIHALANERELEVIEDAAHALPASYEGKKIGGLSKITAFSFYATKTLSTGEGGMVTTDSDLLAERMRLMRLHGMSRDAWKRYSGQGSWRYEVLDAGFKYNLTDLQSALGLVQLTKCDAMRDKRAAIAHLYSSILGQADSYRTPQVPGNTAPAWHLYYILLETETLVIDRDRLIEELRERGVQASVHFIPLHLHPFYQKLGDYRFGDFPKAEDYWIRCLSLPIYPDMTREDVEYVGECLLDIAAKFRR